MSISFRLVSENTTHKFENFMLFFRLCLQVSNRDLKYFHSCSKIFWAVCGSVATYKQQTIKYKIMLPQAMKIVWCWRRRTTMIMMILWLKQLKIAILLILLDYHLTWMEKTIKMRREWDDGSSCTKTSYLLIIIFNRNNNFCC